MQALVLKAPDLARRPFTVEQQVLRRLEKAFKAVSARQARQRTSGEAQNRPGAVPRRCRQQTDPTTFTTSPRCGRS
jgi:hypothetical protein